MWYEKSVFYQIYSFGFCGAPEFNDGFQKNRISKVTDWIGHFKKLGINAIYFCPVFESDIHGYDTKDFKKIDSRLGSNDDFKEMCKSLHDNDIKIVLDAVFNHVGRNFFAFADVMKNKSNSIYKDWFHINFNDNNAYKDEFSYEGWEGNLELVRLNLRNQEVVNYLIDCVKFWIDEFKIDGLRLDVAYMIDHDFMRQVRKVTKAIRSDFFLVGEIIHGDYNSIVNDEMMDSCTNYECYKGLFSSLNDRNLYEIAYSFNRQFGIDQDSLYKGKLFLNFVDNHDVTRIASILKDKNHIPLIYGLLFAMPGIPCIYYGSEWGQEGIKGATSDNEIRPSFQEANETDLTKLISHLIKIHKEHPAFIYGTYKQLFVDHCQLIFEREFNGERYIFAINTNRYEYNARFFYQGFSSENLINGETVNFHENLYLQPYSIMYLKIR